MKYVSLFFFFKKKIAATSRHVVPVYVVVVYTLMLSEFLSSQIWDGTEPWLVQAGTTRSTGIVPSKFKKL